MMMFEFQTWECASYTFHCEVLVKIVVGSLVQANLIEVNLIFFRYNC